MAATVVFDHPTTAALSAFLLERITPEIDGQPSHGRANGGAREAEIRAALAAIPLSRMREAGVMDTLLRLAGLVEQPVVSDGEDLVELIDEMDVESLVKMTLEDDGVLDESEVRS